MYCDAPLASAGRSCHIAPYKGGSCRPEPSRTAMHHLPHHAAVQKGAAGLKYHAWTASIGRFSCRKVLLFLLCHAPLAAAGRFSCRNILSPCICSSSRKCAKSAARSCCGFR